MYTWILHGPGLADESPPLPSPLFTTRVCSSIVHIVIDQYISLLNMAVHLRENEGSREDQLKNWNEEDTSLELTSLLNAFERTRKIPTPYGLNNTIQMGWALEILTVKWENLMYRTMPSHRLREEK